MRSRNSTNRGHLMQWMISLLRMARAEGIKAIVASLNWHLLNCYPTSGSCGTDHADPQVDWSVSARRWRHGCTHGGAWCGPAGAAYGHAQRDLQSHSSAGLGCHCGPTNLEARRD